MVPSKEKTRQVRPTSNLVFHDDADHFSIWPEKKFKSEFYSFGWFPGSQNLDDFLKNLLL